MFGGGGGGRPARQGGVLGVFQACPWFYRRPFEVGGNVFILNSKIHLREISFNAYRKIPKIRPGDFIFQRPFLRGLYSEGLIYGGKFAFQNRLG